MSGFPSTFLGVINVQSWLKALHTLYLCQHMVFLFTSPSLHCFGPQGDWTSHFKIMCHQLAFCQVSQGLFARIVGHIRGTILYIYRQFLSVLYQICKLSSQTLTCESVKKTVLLTISNSSLDGEYKLRGNKKRNNNWTKMLENNPQGDIQVLLSVVR